MHPYLYETEAGSATLRIPAYGVLVLLAFVAAFLLMNWRARQIGVQPERLIPIYIAAAVGGMVGARLLYAFAVEPLQTLSNPLTLITAAGGLAIYGGVLGGAAATFAVAAAMKLPGWKLADMMAPSLMLGMGIGRLGCFFAGCCHGAEAPIGENPIAMLPDGVLYGQVWWSSVFPFVTTEFHSGHGNMSRLHDIPLYPTQLWQAFYLTAICGASMALWNRRRFDGQIAGIILFIEPIGRFLTESYRADERGYAIQWQVDKVPAWLPPGFLRAGEVLPDGTHPGMLVGLTTSQFIGVGILLVAAAILVFRRNAGVAEEIPLPEEV